MLRPYQKINRRKTRVINVGNVLVGGENPITVQTMTNTLTTDIVSTNRQIERAVSAGVDLVRVSVIERHGKNNNIANGFVRGFGLKKGAVASSVGHDAHNIIVAGLNAEDMQCALDRINETQGGIVIFENKKLIAEVQLPIAGLLSDKKASEVADENIEFKKSWVKAGCTLPYMGFNLLPLSVIPNFRITNKGLVDVNSMELQPLFE